MQVFVDMSTGPAPLPEGDGVRLTVSPLVQVGVGGLNGATSLARDATPPAAAVSTRSPVAVAAGADGGSAGNSPTVFSHTPIGPTLPSTAGDGGSDSDSGGDGGAPGDRRGFHGLPCDPTAVPRRPRSPQQISGPAVSGASASECGLRQWVPPRDGERRRSIIPAFPTLGALLSHGLASEDSPGASDDSVLLGTPSPSQHRHARRPPPPTTAEQAATLFLRALSQLADAHEQVLAAVGTAGAGVGVASSVPSAPVSGTAFGGGLNGESHQGESESEDAGRKSFLTVTSPLRLYRHWRTGSNGTALPHGESSTVSPPRSNVSSAAPHQQSSRAGTPSSPTSSPTVGTSVVGAGAAIRSNVLCFGHLKKAKDVTLGPWHWKYVEVRPGRLVYANNPTDINNPLKATTIVFTQRSLAAGPVTTCGPSPPHAPPVLAACTHYPSVCVQVVRRPGVHI